VNLCALFYRQLLGEVDHLYDTDLDELFPSLWFSAMVVS